jgi:molybdopterin synthase sulfur carrier subunit
MALKVLLMGRLRDLAGWRERDLEPTPASLSALREQLEREDEALGAALRGEGVQAAINRALTRGDPPLASGDEIAFMPPMSGG